MDLSKIDYFSIFWRFLEATRSNFRPLGAQNGSLGGNFQHAFLEGVFMLDFGPFFSKNGKPKKWKSGFRYVNNNVP